MVMLIVRYAALFLITGIVIWALVLGWWQSNDHSPSPGESALYLLALPIALFGGFVFLNAFIKNMRTPSAPPETAPDSSTSTIDPAALASEAGLRRRQLAVLANSIYAPGSVDAAGFLDVVREGKTPQPDKQLKDDDGFPAFVARIAEVDDLSNAEHLAQFDDVAEWPNGFVRNMAILEQVLIGILPDTLSLIDTDKASDVFLRIVWITDAKLDKTQLERAHAWLMTHHFSGIASGRLDLAIEMADDDIALPMRINQLCDLTPDATEDAVTLLLATASNVSEVTLRQWQARGTLFLPDQQNGQIPGEMGAAVLLAAPLLATQLSDEKPILVSRPNAQARDKSADAGGRISADLCTRLCEELLSLFECTPDQLGALVTDSDHRASRQAEALGVITEDFTQLEPTQDFLALGTAAGTAPPASALLMLACATELSREKDGPVLALSVQHPTRRAAMLLMPAPDPVSSPPSE